MYIFGYTLHGPMYQCVELKDALLVKVNVSNSVACTNAWAVSVNHP